MTPAEFILTHGYCQYCETPINDNDRCGCDQETIWYLTQAVEILEEALQPLADVWNYRGFVWEEIYRDMSQQYIWKASDHPGISIADAKRANDAMDKVAELL